MVILKIRQGEPFERAMRKFKRKVENEGIMRDLKKKRYHMTRSEKKREKRKLAEKRRRKALKKMVQKK
jgi:small subunit ribosomal protein S21